MEPKKFSVFLKNQLEPVIVIADSFEFNFNLRNAAEVDPKLLFLKSDEQIVSIFVLGEIQGFVALDEPL